jgi:hypothetical protein
MIIVEELRLCPNCKQGSIRDAIVSYNSSSFDGEDIN